MRERSPLFLPPLDAEAQWENFTQKVRQEMQPFFDATGPIVGARAPGRLDVMGGIADYSGSIVLEMPISEAAFVAWQWREDRFLKIRSARAEAEGMTAEVMISLDEFTDAGRLHSARRRRSPQSQRRSRDAVGVLCLPAVFMSCSALTGAWRRAK